MDNREKLRALISKHKLYQHTCAAIICSVTGRPCSVRAVRSWVNDPTTPSARNCPDWVIELLTEYFKKDDSRD